MVIDLNLLFLYVVAVISLIIIPGPVILLVTGAGLSGGAGKALRTIFGTNLASLVLIVFSVLVVKGLFAVNEIAFNVLKFAGACYIATMGWEVLRETRRASRQQDTIQPRIGGLVRGFVIGISNPKDILFFVAFFPQFMTITNDNNASIALLTMTWIILDFATLMLVYLLVQKLLKPSVHRVMMLVSGILLLLVALGSIAMTSVDLFRISGI
ncbi:MAG: Putative lysine exporter protein [Candidatus Tokpelaia hoelldobleri]|uniref:Lysine exporter protein n=1 Tax=Candidatus Tokpelaia hoelldobleri TaxID=1902579 RepID=A0A1U9JUM6_9HYPH|nr:MAG: Putative lysine exporter protein [Candidatus Tokpelaia hoelldoblerii]